jgi:hypothetical protein
LIKDLYKGVKVLKLKLIRLKIKYLKQIKTNINTINILRIYEDSHSPNHPFTVLFAKLKKIVHHLLVNLS